MRILLALSALLIASSLAAGQDSRPSQGPTSRPAPAPASKPARVEASVPPPWSERDLRRAIRVGQKWTIEFRMTFWVGAKKQTKKERVEIEVTGFGLDTYTLTEKTYNSLGKCVSERNKTARYDQPDALYGQFLVKETKVSLGEVETAGRKWRARLYENRRMIEAQEQVLRIWNSIDQPGIVVRTVFKGPRMEWEGLLTKFEEPSAKPPSPGKH